MSKDPSFIYEDTEDSDETVLMPRADLSLLDPEARPDC